LHDFLAGQKSCHTILAEAERHWFNLPIALLGTHIAADYSKDIGGGIGFFDE
jgi:hypothetical protein